LIVIIKRRVNKDRIFLIVAISKTQGLRHWYEVPES
jgi:hypothetical protein